MKAIELKMPSLSPTMSAGTIVRWAKAEGEAVEAGDLLCEVQTDKAVVGMEADEAGTLARILIPANRPDVSVGSPIAVIAEEDEDWKQVQQSAASSSSDATSSVSDKGEDSEQQSKTTAKESGSAAAYRFGPAVRLMLAQFDLDAAKLTATGRDNKLLLKEDVLSYVAVHKLEPVAQDHLLEQETQVKAVDKVETEKTTLLLTSRRLSRDSTYMYTDVPLTNMRKTIAKRLLHSKQTVPHCYATASCSLRGIADLRNRFKAEGTKISVNDIIIKACAVSLRQTDFQLVPEVNVGIGSDGLTVESKSEVDVSVAVATDAGLITPIVKSADQLNLREIGTQIKELSQKARESRLQLHEFQGGTFTVSNLGMFGIVEFTAIINPPQAAILAVGGSRSAASADGTSDERMSFTLCFDNRAVGEHGASRFLQTLAELLENPTFLQVGTTTDGPAERVRDADKENYLDSVASAFLDN